MWGRVWTLLGEHGWASWVLDCQGRAGMRRAHRPGVLGILDEVPSIEQLILYRL